jgi:hypothetical protein
MPPSPDSQNSQQQQPRSGASIVKIKTGCTDDEAQAVVALIEAEKKPSRSLLGLVHKIGQDGELPDWLARVRASGHRADIANWLDTLAGKPPCPHGVAGGDQLRPDTGKPQCVLCRNKLWPDGRCGLCGRESQDSVCWDCTSKEFEQGGTE